MKYIVRSLDGREYGPFTSAQLRELKDSERLGPGDFIRRETGKTWSPFEKIPGLGDVDGDEAQIRDDAPDAGPSSIPVAVAEESASGKGGAHDDDGGAPHLRRPCAR